MNLATLRARLSTDEGLRYKPYVDTVGKVTIGIGHNLTDSGLSEAAVDLIFQEDIDRATSAAATFSWYQGLDEIRQMIVVCMVFNMGLGGFSQFRMAISALQSGDFAAAADDFLLSQWAKQVGNRAKVYAQIIRSGVWQ